jgi:phosphoribosylformylglycinamidine synthase
VGSGARARAHDVAEGGLAVALAECCLAGGLGAKVELEGDRADEDALHALLFGEGPGGFLVSGAEEGLRELAERERSRADGVQLRLIGTVGGDALEIALAGGAGASSALAIELVDLAGAHGALRELFA